MGGAIGYTGVLGNSPAQVIAGLEKSVGGDGTKPRGTIYFEENDDIRSGTREDQWASTKAQLDARGVRWIEKRNVPGSTPRNRGDVRGAVVGRADITLPNGSSYLPGSWADNLTSYGATFDTLGQTKATAFIAAGAAATAGTVQEPLANPLRFTNSSIFTFIDDGSTLGEAFYKSVAVPDVQMFIGDLLAQPYADVPAVAITSGPSNGATVSGTIAVDVASWLSEPKIATGIARLDLYVNGLLTDSQPAGSGTFTVDTTLLPDGRHEFRVVAVNNAAAESQGYLLRHLSIDNRGRSVAVPLSNLSLEPNEVVSVPISTVAGDGSVTRVELRRLGAPIGHGAADAGSISIEAKQLAYGTNVVTPVAVFSDGSEVAGDPIVVERQARLATGAPVLPLEARVSGIRAEYFLGRGRTTIAASDFGGTPDIVTVHESLNLAGGIRTSLGASAVPLATAEIDRLAARFSGFFEVSADKRGEYEFFFWQTNDSVELRVNGLSILGFDNVNEGLTPGWGGSIWLDAGQHELTLLAANMTTSTRPDFFDVSLRYRGPDGITRLADRNFLYVQAVPEPGGGIVVAGWLVAGWVATRLRSRKERRS